MTDQKTYSPINKNGYFYGILMPIKLNAKLIIHEFPGN